MAKELEQPKQEDEQPKTRARKSRSKSIPCKNCGRIISTGIYGKREFCNQACQKAHYRKNKKEKAAQ